MKLQTNQFYLPVMVILFAIVPGDRRPGVVFAQEPASLTNIVRANSVHRAHPFENGEELIYVAEFSRSLLKKVDIAEFRFTAGKVKPPEKPAGAQANQGSPKPSYLLKFTGDVTSKGFFTKLFDLQFREQLESIVEPSSFTVQRSKRVDEHGKRARTSETVYDNGKVLWIERDPNNPSRPPRTATTNFTGQVQDLLSAIYFVRTQPLELGKTLELAISDSGRIYQVPVHIVEKKRMKTVLGRIETLRVEAEVYGPNRMIDGKGQFWVWFSNDRRRIPVKIRIKSEYGTFDITLRKAIENSQPHQYLTRQ